MAVGDLLGRRLDAVRFVDLDLGELEARPQKRSQVGIVVDDQHAEGPVGGAIGDRGSLRDRLLGISVAGTSRSARATAPTPSSSAGSSRSLHVVPPIFPIVLRRRMTSVGQTNAASAIQIVQVGIVLRQMALSERTCEASLLRGPLT